MLETAWSWHVVRTSFGKFHATLQAKGVLYHMTFDISRFRGKMGQGGQEPGPHHPGRLSHCYRCDNIALIIRPSPRPPRLLFKSAGPRSGIGHSMGLSVRGKSSYAPEKRSGRGLLHQVECPQMADAAIE